jgi:hypothetical protein
MTALLARSLLTLGVGAALIALGLLLRRLDHITGGTQ